MGNRENMSNPLSALMYATASMGLLLIACSMGNSASHAGYTVGAGGSSNQQGLGGTGSDGSLDDAGTDSSHPQDAAPTPCPGTTVASCPPIVPSFARTVTPIVKSRCNTCHTLTNDAGLWPLDDLQSLSDWQFSILQDLRACTQPPPKSGVSLTMNERMAFEAWLVCGAPDN